MEEEPGYKAFQNLYTVSRCIQYTPAIADLLRLSNPGRKLHIPENVKYEFLDLIDKTEYAAEFSKLNSGEFKNGKIEIDSSNVISDNCDQKDPRHHNFIF